MSINRNTDIIRQNDKSYLNATSSNRLIAKLVMSSAETVRGFNMQFGSSVDKETVEEMKGTYWLRVPIADNIVESDEVAIVEL